MKKLTSLLPLLFAVILLFSACEKEDNIPYDLFIENPFSFEIRIASPNIAHCGFDENYMTNNQCLFWPGKIFASEDSYQKMPVKVYDIQGNEVGATVVNGQPGKFYKWVAGYDNEVTEL